MVKKGQKSVYVVIECPLKSDNISNTGLKNWPKSSKITSTLGDTKVSTAEVGDTSNIFISTYKEKYPKVSLKLMNVETCRSLSKNAKLGFSTMNFEVLKWQKLTQI